MYNEQRKRLYLYAVIFTAGVILCLVTISAADIHPDGKFHSDCPLCQFKLNNTAPDIHIGNYTACSFPVLNTVFCPHDIVIPAKKIFTDHQPHAPPAQT